MNYKGVLPKNKDWRAISEDLMFEKIYYYFDEGVSFQSLHEMEDLVINLNNLVSGFDVFNALDIISNYCSEGPLPYPHDLYSYEGLFHTIENVLINSSDPVEIYHCMIIFAFIATIKHDDESFFIQNQFLEKTIGISISNNFNIVTALMIMLSNLLSDSAICIKVAVSVYNFGFSYISEFLFSIYDTSIVFHVLRFFYRLVEVVFHSNEEALSELSGCIPVILACVEKEEKLALSILRYLLGNDDCIKTVIGFNIENILINQISKVDRFTFVNCICCVNELILIDSYSVELFEKVMPYIPKILNSMNENRISPILSFLDHTIENEKDHLLEIHKVYDSLLMYIECSKYINKKDTILFFCRIINKHISNESMKDNPIFKRFLIQIFDFLPYFKDNDIIIVLASIQEWLEIDELFISVIGNQCNISSSLEQIVNDRSDNASAIARLLISNKFFDF